MQADWFQTTFTVKGYECDSKGHMQLGALLRRVQQISTDQCNLLGLTAQEYERTGTAFLLAKMSAEFYAPVCNEEPVILTTRPSAARRAVYSRYTQLTNQAGEVLAAVDARWVLIRTDTWRILRTPPQELALPFCAVDVPQLDVRMEKAPQLELVGRECATYTRCDMYRHLNNTCYADIVCDHMPLQEMAAGRIKRFAVAYHKEVPMGESFALYCGRTAQDSWYFTGKEGDALHFEAELTLQTPEQ